MVDSESSLLEGALQVAFCLGHSPWDFQLIPHSPSGSNLQGVWLCDSGGGRNEEEEEGEKTRGSWTPELV